MSLSRLRILRTIFTLLAVLAIATLPTTLPAHGAAVYYLSPTGDNGNTGTQASPWKTFAFAIPRLVAGDTLILLDGRYDRRTTGLPSINCASGARNGTASSPITFTAQKERRALLLGDGWSSTIKIQNCSYWSFSGIYSRQVDNPYASGGTGFNIHLLNSHHITVQRCLAYGVNRYRNVSVIVLENTHDSLIEECEAYFFHRKGISLGANASRNVIRRNYVHSRSAANVCEDCEGGGSGQSSRRGDEGINLGYPGSDNIAENNVSEGSYTGFAVNASGTSDRNRFYGNIALDDGFGFLVTSRGAGPTRTPHDTLLTDNAAIDSSISGVYLRGAENTKISNMTILNTLPGFSGHGMAADRSVLNYITEAFRCNAETAPCGNGDSSTHILNSLSVNNAGIGFAFNPQLQDGGWSIRHSNAYSNNRDYWPNPDPTNSAMNPQLGSCKLWIPDGSPMQRAGSDGEDIGANILYRYANGILTDQRLWDFVTGAFPHGAIVPGVNDIGGESAFDVHSRLNVNSNGCRFPARYANVGRGSVTVAVNSPIPKQSSPPGIDAMAWTIIVGSSHCRRLLMSRRRLVST
jgi:hypothetical protein